MFEKNATRPVSPLHSPTMTNSITPCYEKTEQPLKGYSVSIRFPHEKPTGLTPHMFPFEAELTFTYCLLYIIESV